MRKNSNWERTVPRHPGAALHQTVLQLALHLERDDDAEQGGAFDEGGEDQGRRLDPTSGFRLMRHALDGLTADAAVADARANDGEASAETGANAHETTTFLSRSLEHGDDGVQNHCI